MRDLSFQEALDDPDGPFRQFVEECIGLWNRAVEVYEAAGSPNGPAEDDDNVTRWFIDRMEDLDAVQAAQQMLVES